MSFLWTRISRVGLIRVFLLLAIVTNGYAQNSAQSIARCAAGWGIFGDRQTNNDVCKIAQELMDHCVAGPAAHRVTIEPVDSSSWYEASDIGELPDCACTRIMYNMLSVCAACQKSNFDPALLATNFTSISDYASQTCDDFHGENQPLPLKPSNSHDGQNWTTMAPQWSQTLNNETFDLQKAYELVSPASTTPNSTTPTPSEAAPNETKSPAASSNSSSSGPNIGAIVGGVVGGLAFLGAIIALVFFLCHRKRRTRDVAPSDEFLKPEYYATPPLLSATNDRRDSEYRDDIAEEELTPAISQRLSWAGGLVPTRRTQDNEGGEMLPPFTQGTYIGPSPHEKGVPARRRTDESDVTMRTTTTNTLLLSSPTRPGTSENA